MFHVVNEREPGECSRTPSPKQSFIHANVPRGSQISLPRNGKHATGGSVIELVDLVTDDEENEENIESSDEERCHVETNLFILDTVGFQIIDVEECDVESSTALINDAKNEECISVPEMFSTGRKKFNASNDILTNDVPSSSDEKKESTFKVNCFNCDGEHSFQDCELPLDHQRIAANRAVHFNNKRVTQERYTSAGEIGSNSSLKLRPGEISDTLREALGIGRSDIPEWIYRMRRRGFIDGYPPGYLAEGQSLNDESLLEFHTDDKTLETSVIQETSKLRSSTLAVDKIIAYPGFNYYNRNLNDCECFRVPRFTEYIKYLQEYVGAIYMQSEISSYQNSTTKRRKHWEQRENDCKRLKGTTAESHENGLFYLQAAENLSDESELKADDTSLFLDEVSTASSSNNSPSSSNHRTLFGTPVAYRGEHEKKPSLENFRDGIVPFEALRENTKNYGFFRKLLTKIRMRK